MKNKEFQAKRLLSLRELQLLQLDAMKSIHAVCVQEGINYYMIGGTLLGAIRHRGFIPWDDDIDIAMFRCDYERFKRIFKEHFSSDNYFLQSYDTDQDFRPAMLRVCIKGTYQDLRSEAHLKNCKNTYIDIFPLDNVPDEKTLQEKHAMELQKTDRLIELKLYHQYPNNSYLYILLKKIVSILLRIIPLSYLQERRVRIMTRYADTETRNVSSTVSKYGYMKQVMDKRIYGVPTLYKFEDTEFYGVENYDAYLSHLFGQHYMQIPSEEKREKPHDVYLID